MSLARMAGAHPEGDLELPEIDEKTMHANVRGVFIAGTSIAGTKDQFRIFIENCYAHAQEIMAAIQGRLAVSMADSDYLRPET